MFDFSVDFVNAALVKWLAEGKPMFPSAPLQDRREKPEPKPDVWASAMMQCPRRHLAEKLGIPAIFPELQGFETYRKLIFHYASYVEVTWYSIFRYSYPDTSASTKVRSAGLSGGIDVLIQHQGVQIPVEVKCSGKKMQAYQMSQLVAYLTMLEHDAGDDWSVPFGILLIDGASGGYEAVKIIRDGDVWTARTMADEPYTYYNKEYRLPVAEVQESLAAHRAAWERYEAAKASGMHWADSTDLLTPDELYWYTDAPRRAQPITGQCLYCGGKGKAKSAGTASVSCPWFCWDSEPQNQYPIIGGNQIQVNGNDLLQFEEGSWA